VALQLGGIVVLLLSIVVIAVPSLLVEAVTKPRTEAKQAGSD